MYLLIVQLKRRKKLVYSSKRNKHTEIPEKNNREKNVKRKVVQVNQMCSYV